MTETQHLYLVFGGVVTDPQTLNFADLKKVDTIGIFGTYEEAEAAWRGASMASIDDAMSKYAIVHLHKLLTPEE